MRFPFSKKLVLISSLIVLVTVAMLFILPKDKIDFNTQVKPILNRKCISCHGGVKQKGGFSVLFREEALGNTESGKPAIIPGSPGKSELIRRITETDPDERM
ncbi:MAG: c-type cytochrome domain-containing protein, partial [Chitinophagaceae bacterium]